MIGSQLFDLLWSKSSTAVLLGAVVVATPISVWHSRRRNINLLVNLLAIYSVVAILTFTQPFAGLGGVRGLNATWDLRVGLTWWTHGWSTVGLVATDREAVLNVALFMPAAVLCSFAYGLKRTIFLGLVCLSFLIETSQAVVGQTRTADPGDLIANATGAALGCILAFVLSNFCSLGIIGSFQALRIRWLTPRLAQKDAATLVLIVVCVLGIQTLIDFAADSRNDELISKIESAYSQSSLEEVVSVLNADDAQAFQTFIARPGITADYLLRVDDLDMYEARFDTGTAASHRCVFVTWLQAGVTFRGESGRACTQTRVQ